MTSIDTKSSRDDLLEFLGQWVKENGESIMCFIGHDIASEDDDCVEFDCGSILHGSAVDLTCILSSAMTAHDCPHIVARALANYVTETGNHAPLLAAVQIIASSSKEDVQPPSDLPQ